MYRRQSHACQDDPVCAFTACGSCPLYQHYRPNAGWQSEAHFSDGTLRMLALLWSLLEGNSLLLLEEPEISLNDAVVREIPLIIDRLQRNRKSRRQVII